MKTMISGLIALLLCPFLWGQGLGLPGPITHTAVQNGNWNQASTWNTGNIPGNNAIVDIPPGTRVVVTSEETARIKFLQIRGEFRFSIHYNTRLLVETVMVRPDGFFMIGNETNTVKPDKKAELVIINDGNPIDLNWDPSEVSRGFISMGKVRIYGDPVTHQSIMDASITKNQSVLDLKVPVPGDWEVGDSIVLAGTVFKRDQALQDEVFAIAGINGTQITLDHPTQYDHWRVRTDMMLHVAHLTRNVIIRSESKDIPLRGHVMLMNGDVDIRHAAFIDLGRTNKAEPLDEKVVDLQTGNISNGPRNNIRGRYSLHFHKNGILPGQAPPSKVYGCVVRRTPGWGFVNHSSHVDFRYNVCHDFLGSAFVTELGDELGNFFYNVAIHGEGEPYPGTTGAMYDNKYKPIRIVFENPYRPQVIGDFAFSGDGFWFQGPAIRARGNVANSCNGSGMIWFATGSVDIADNFYAGFPRSAVAGAYSGYPGISGLEARSWIYSNDSLVLSDLPILECDSLDAYACLVGFRLRFVNFNNNAFYKEANLPWDYTQDIVALPGKSLSYANRLRQTVSNLNLWNNEQGFRMRYNEKTDFVNVKNINRLDFHPRKDYAGAEFFHQSNSITFDQLTISGYAVAGWIINNTHDNTGQITFANTSYGSYSNADTKKTQVACGEVTGLSVSGLSATSATLNWSSHASATRFLIRYKIDGTQKWSMPVATGFGTNSYTLTGLRPGATYIYQVNAGCPENVSLWSWPEYFTTPTSKRSDGWGALSAQSGIRIHPNPAQEGRFEVLLPEGLSAIGIQVVDALGRVILEQSGDQRLVQMPTTIKSGVYLVRVQSERGIETLRLVVP